MSSKSIDIVFYGTPEFAAVSLLALLRDERYNIKLVVTQPDRKSGRGNKLKSSVVKQLALENKIPVLQPENIKKNTSEFLSELEEYGPFDLGVLLVFGQIIPLEVLNFPIAGTINVHPSLLPRWRGASPMRKAILAGDAETGVCLMKMEAGLDSGPVYTTFKTKISPEETAGELHDRLALISAEQLVNNLDKIFSGAIIAKAQAIEGVTYASKITAADALIDWSLSSDKIIRQTLAMNPEPGAYTFLGSKRLKIFKCCNSNTESEASIPGKILKLSDSMLEVATGSGIVSLKEVQLEGKKRMLIAEFLKGQTITLDQYLGEKSV